MLLYMISLQGPGWKFQPTGAQSMASKFYECCQATRLIDISQNFTGAITVKKIMRVVQKMNKITDCLQKF